MNLKPRALKIIISLILGIVIGSFIFQGVDDCPVDVDPSVITDCGGNLLVRTVIVLVASTIIYLIWSFLQKSSKA